jgi:HSP20 family molecular chaperone IbpA
LGDYVEVVEAKVVDGILSIELEQKIPEEKLPKTIAIK